MALKSEVPEGFTNPKVLPESTDQASQWQAANRSWWERHPMRYDWKEGIGHPEFSRGFYEEIDRRFFACAHEYMPWQKIPFDALIDFEWLKSQDVLEIGTGNGSHAMLLARHARSFTGIDITDYAVRSTSRRLQCFGVGGTILHADAEHMPFDNEVFDFIWTWGVIHHSSNTKAVLKEMDRVLKPGGRAVTMVYHRNPWNFYVIGGFFKGILQGELLKAGSLHNIIQQTTDGALARYYSAAEWKDFVSPFFEVEDIRIFGNKAEIIPLPGGRIKTGVMSLIPNQVSRFLTNQCRFGTFLVSVLRKSR